MAPTDVEAAWAKGRIGIARVLPDDRLARRAAGGDEGALAAIFDRYHQDLYRFCLAIVGSPADAQDALQNTMVKVLRALPGEERQIELKPWLYRIAHNESVEMLRRRRPTEELDAELTAGGGSLAEDAEARARLRRLLADLELLPDRQRGALVMRELGGLDFEEIGAALGTSPAAARQTLYEARQSLRQMDEGREMDCDAVTRALSDADGRVTRRRDIRAHLRACPDCRRFSEEIEGRRQDLGALAPLPALAATGLLQGLLGGAAAGGAAKSLGAGAAIKSAAAVAAVAVVGAGAADRSGVVDVTPWGGGSQAQQESGGAAASGDDAPPRLPGAEIPKSGSADREGGAARLESAAALGGAVRAGQGIDRGGSETAPQGGAGDGTSAVAPDAGRTHPNGRNHEKQHPDAAAHGEQTAAEHKAAGKGGGQGQGSKGQGSKAAKDPKPSKPAQGDASPKSNQAPVESKPEQAGGGSVSASPKGPSGTPPSHPGPSLQGEAKGDQAQPSP